MTTPSPDTIDLSSASHMGDLARGGTTWSVYLETRQDGPITAGQLAPLASHLTFNFPEVEASMHGHAGGAPEKGDLDTSRSVKSEKGEKGAGG